MTDWRSRLGAVRRGVRVSPLTLRILAVNMLAPAMLVGGILYLNDFQESLIARRQEALRVRGEIIAGAIGESATGGPETTQLDRSTARLVIGRLVGPTRHQARLFDAGGDLIADSRFLGSGSGVRENPLPPLDDTLGLTERIERLLDAALDAVTPTRQVPLFPDGIDISAEDLEEVRIALTGRSESRIRRLEDGTLILSAAVPVQRFRRIQGVLLLTSDTRDIETAVRREQILILAVFAVTLAITLLLTFFLAGTIGRPIRRLAQAAEQVRDARGRDARMPDFPNRRDEIGELARSLSAMTDALYAQIDRIESFAADVAHELKNPLSSLRSAVDSLARTNDPDIQARLHAVIQSDVKRLDRLISDISDASRLDAELSRGDWGTVDLTDMARTMVETYQSRSKYEDRSLSVDLPRHPEMGTPISVRVPGMAGRLAQLLSNLIDNALSFTPPGGGVRVSVSEQDGRAILAVEDDGPGLPSGAEEKIFSRFYSERPPGEEFGAHSGLGLSICRQVVTAHRGTIQARNTVGDDGRVTGARFEVSLPLDLSAVA